MVTKIKLMKRLFVFLFFVVVMAVWCTPSFAARQTVTGSGNLDDSTGVIDGVNMVNAVTIGTLTVGTQDIFTHNTLPYISSNLAVSADGDSRSDITFNGSSTVYGGIGGANVLRNIVAGATGTTVNFLGAVNATTLNVGTGTVNFKSGSSNSTATNFTGNGKISLDPDTSLIGALTTNTGGTGTLELNSGSVLDGAVGGANGISTISLVDVGSGVSSRITGAVNAYNFSLLNNTLDIGPVGVSTGALTTGSNGAITTTLDSKTIYGTIIPGGAASIGSGLIVTVVVTPGASIPVGTIFKIVNAQSGSDGTFTVISPAGYTFVAVPVASGLVQIVATSTQTTSTVAAPLNSLIQATVNSADLAGVLGNINALSGSAQDNANAQLIPSIPSLAAPLVTYQGAREFQNLWLSRLDGCGQVSWPSEDKENCKGKDARSGWWLKGFGYFGDQDARAASTGYNSQIIGSMLAYDVPIGLNTRAGLGFGYARSAIKGKTFDARTDFDTYQATAYIGHEQGPWFVDGSASFGWNEYSDKRHIQFTGEDRRANAKYSGQAYTAFGRTGFHIPVPMKFTITPLASLQYSRVNIEGYTEKGANDLSLKVESQHYNYLESGLGAKVERNFSFRSLTLVPEVRFEWLHMISNPKLAQSSAYTPAGSESTKTDGLHTVADTYHVGTGLTLLSCACSATSWSLEGGYDYYWRVDGYAANQVTARVTARF
jgi:uncharacterized protein with beta-barrel porin domain